MCQAAAFEPQVDSQSLASMSLVLAATAGCAGYWWWSVVPSARRTLAKEKRAGPFNEYLVGLQQDPSSKKVERWFFTDYLRQLERRQELARGAAAKRAAAASPATTVQQLQQHQQPEELVDQQQPASSLQQELPQDVYVDKQPSFWSLDNPVLATAALLGAIVLISSVLH